MQAKRGRSAGRGWHALDRRHDAHARKGASLARFVQIQSGVRLEDWEEEDNEPRKVKWREAALDGAAGEACEAALALNAELERLLLEDGLSDYDRDVCEDVRDRVHEATRDVWPIARITPPWQRPTANPQEQAS